MIKSKYLGRTYDNNWKVVAVELAGRYGKRGAKGNSYRFFLARETSDGKFDKTMCISHNTMVKIDRAELSVEQLETSKRQMEGANVFRNAIYYRFK